MRNTISSTLRFHIRRVMYVIIVPHNACIAHSIVPRKYSAFSYFSINMGLRVKVIGQRSIAWRVRIHIPDGWRGWSLNVCNGHILTIDDHWETHSIIKIHLSEGLKKEPLPSLNGYVPTYGRTLSYEVIKWSKTSNFIKNVKVCPGWVFSTINGQDLEKIPQIRAVMFMCLRKLRVV